MKTFSYIKADGTKGSVQAADAREAEAMAKDRKPNSGFAEERTLPDMNETGKESELPETPPSQLMTFVEATRRATQLARQARNKKALTSIGGAYPKGILPNFGSILDNLNTASDDFADDLTAQLDEALEAGEKKYEMRTVGRQLIQFELGPNGEVVGQKLIATAPKESTGNGTIDFFTDTAQRELMQGRLTSAPPEVQVIFSNAPDDFRASWIRNNVGTDNSGVTANALLKDLESWEAWNSQKKSKVVNPFAVTPGT